MSQCELIDFRDKAPMSVLDKILPLELLDYVKGKNLMDTILSQKSQPLAKTNKHKNSPTQDASETSENDS